MTTRRQSQSAGAGIQNDSRVPEYRYFLNKLRQNKGWTNRRLARELGTPDALLDARERQLEHFFLESENPRTGLAKAVERALGVTLEAEDYGWNPEAL